MLQLPSELNEIVNDYIYGNPTDNYADVLKQLQDLWDDEIIYDCYIITTNKNVWKTGDGLAYYNRTNYYAGLSKEKKHFLGYTIWDVMVKAHLRRMFVKKF